MVRVLKNGKLAAHYDDYQWRCERCPGAGLDARDVLREWGGVNVYSGGKGIEMWLIANDIPCFYVHGDLY
jgi:hypothetical protein